MKILMELDLTKASSEIRRLAIFTPKVVGQAMFTSAHKILIPAIRSRLKENKSIFRGELFQKMAIKSSSGGRDPTSGRFTAGDSGGGSGVKVSDSDLPFVEVGTFGVPYGLNVERGSPPHVADRTKIYEYVEKKMGIPEPGTTRVTDAIMNTIGEDGTEAHPFLEPVWEDKQGEFFTDVVSRAKAKLEKS